jgi:NADH-quinone oxidoreductase subunit C
MRTWQLDGGVIQLSSSEVATAEDAPAPRDEQRESIVAQLRDILGEGVLEHHVVPGKDLWVRVDRNEWTHAAESIRMTLGARHFGFLSAIDWMPSPFGRSMDSAVDNQLGGATRAAAGDIKHGFAGGDTRFQVILRVANISDRWGITLKADVDDDQPEIASICSIFAGANWHEREAHEMFGINFLGHPGLHHIYLPGDFEGYPLRKDFPLLARMIRPWPGIVDVEPMPGGSDEDEGEAS